METLQAQGKTEKDLIEWLGLSNGTFTMWKYRNGKSYKKYLDRIAEFLTVNPDYLSGEADDILRVSSLSPQEIRLIQFYRKMGKDEKETIIRSAEFFVMASESRGG